MLVKSNSARCGASGTGCIIPVNWIGNGCVLQGSGPSRRLEATGLGLATASSGHLRALQQAVVADRGRDASARDNYRSSTSVTLGKMRPLW